MPSREARIIVIVFWMVMTSWLVYRDLLPQWGFGELNYRVLLADRAVEETSRWRILLDGKRLGSVHSIVRPETDGSHRLKTSVEFNLQTLTESANLQRLPNDELSLSRLLLQSEFLISPMGKLETLSIIGSVESTRLRFQLEGMVRGNKLFLVNDGLPFLKKESEFSLDPQTLIISQIGPLDRIPNLWVGKRWITRFVDPFKRALPNLVGGFLGGTDLAMEIIHNEVTSMETISWRDQSWACFAIEHRHDNQRGKTWVRASDGLVLRQESVFSGRQIIVELDPLP